MNNLNSFDEEIYSEIKKVMDKKVARVKEKAKKHKLDGKYEGKVTVENCGVEKIISISFWGQGVWTDEFGKGLGIGVLGRDRQLFDGNIEKHGLNYERMTVTKSALWKEYSKTIKNPMRSAKPIYKRTDNKKRQAVSYERNGKTISYMKNKYTWRKSDNATREVRLYSRPGGYKDIDGKFHISKAKNVFSLENPWMMKNNKYKQLSHGASFIITEEFGFNFLQNKQRGHLLTQMEADNLSEVLCKKAEEYIYNELL
jgi:hypothetical protein